MNKEAFERGFIKAAVAKGLDLFTAIKLANQSLTPAVNQTLAPSRVPVPLIPGAQQMSQAPDAMANTQFNIPATSMVGQQMQHMPQMSQPMNPQIPVPSSIAGIRG